MSEDQEDIGTLQSPLPFGHRVQSEVFELENSVQVLENQAEVNCLFELLKDTIESAKMILRDQKLSDSLKVRQTLKILKQQASDSGEPLAKIKSKQEQPHRYENQQTEEKGQETIQIVLDQNEVMSSCKSKGNTSSEQSSGQQRETNNKPKQKIQSQNSSQQIDELKNLLNSKENQIILLRKEKKENEMRLQREITDLKRKVDMGEQKSLLPQDPKKAGNLKEKNLELSKMNKWLQTLNKLLQGAQRQAANSKEELKRSQQANAKYIKQKDEEIRVLKEKLESPSINQRQSVQEHCSSIIAIFNQLQASEKNLFKQKLTQFLQFSS